MGGSRLALIVANDAYDDPELGRLEAPAHDAKALAAVLGDPGVGSFEVKVMHNEAAQDVRVAVEEFFADRSAEDLLLLHFSGHGVKNADGELFLALRDTRPRVLAATGLPADFMNRQMAASRAQRIALFLDCCYGGAFPRGMVVRAAGEARVKDSFTDQEELAGGRGRVVVTASNAMQYSFEGGKLSDHSESPSVFSGALVDALASGEADEDGDGWIGMNELFSYLKKSVVNRSPNQTPQMWTFGSTGDMRIARSRVRRIVATPLDPRLVEALADELPAVRYGLVDLFRERLAADDLGRALAAWNQLLRLQKDDSNRVSDAADAAVAGAALQVTPTSVDLELDESGVASGELAFSGPPLALAFTAVTDVPWLQVEYADPLLRIHVSDPGVADAAATVTLTSPIGVRTVPVRVRQRERDAAGEEAGAGISGADAPPVDKDAPSEESPSADQTSPPEEKPRVEEDPPVDRDSGVVTPPDDVGSTQRPGWRRWLLWAVGAGVVVVVGVVLASLWGGDGGGDDAGGGVSLPLGPVLPDDVLVWTNEKDWTIEMGAAGGSVSPLLETDAATQWPMVLPDRRTVLYLAFPGGEAGDLSDSSLRVVASDGTGDRELFSGSDACPHPGRPALNPDGDQIVLPCFGDDDERLKGLRILDFDGNEIRTLDEDAVVGAPTWSQDGEVIVYWAQNDATIRGRPGQSLWAVPADGSEPPTRLTTTPTVDAVPAISPDLKWIVYVQITKEHTSGDLYLIEIIGDSTIGTPERMQASVTDVDDHDPTWAPDSSAIVYSADGVLMEVPPDVTASPERLFGDAVTSGHMPAWARR